MDGRGRLLEVAPWDGRPSADVEDLRAAGVLLPGFVDTHLHFPQTRVIGSASGPLLEWLARSVFPEEARFAERTHAEAVAEVFCTRLAAAGTTLSMVYGSVHAEAADVLFGALDRHGLRAFAGPVLMDEDSPAALTLTADRALPALEALAERWDGHDGGRLRVAVIPRFALSCSLEMMRGAGELAARRGLTVTTHLAETLAECALVRERFGADDYMSVYADTGLLVPGAVFAHCIHLSDREWRHLIDADAVVSHCPDSNYFLGSGNMPVDEVLKLGARLGVGTDVAAGRTFRIPGVLSSAYDNARQRSADVTPADLLWWGTRGGAQALGVDHVGLLEAGYEADMTLWPVHGWADDADAVLAHVLFDRDAGPASRTWVRGREVWRQTETTP